MVRTQDLLQHIIKVSRGQGTQDQDIKYEHMVRELGNISKTVLQHSGDPGLRLSSCLPWPLRHVASCPCTSSPAAIACSCPCPAFSASQPGRACVCVAARVGCRCETGVEVGRIGEKMTRNEYFVFAAGLDCLSFWSYFVLIATPHVFAPCLLLPLHGSVLKDRREREEETASKSVKARQRALFLCGV
jgi:hypothetical protein